jgi:hypothetical protein
MTGVTVDEVPLVVTAFRHARGIKVLNPRAELTADKNAFLNVLADTDILCMNEKEFSAYVDGGDPEQALSLLHRAFGGRVVIVTKGSEGLLLVDKNGKRHEIPACISGDEIDATGAGDAFLATFLVRYLSGDTAVEAAQYGSFVAGIAVTKVGGSNTVTTAEMGIFSEEKVMQEYQFDPSQFENGALKPVIGKEVRQGKFRDCPACCIGPYCRDGDVELIYNETHGVYYYECGFVYNETEACGFRYPGDWENDDPRIEALAKIHRAFLSSLRQEVAA